MADATSDLAALERTSLGSEGARNLATTTNTVPQMRGVSPRYLLKLLPWVAVESGTYRVNSVRLLRPEMERLIESFPEDGNLEAKHLRAVPLLRDLDRALASAIAKCFQVRSFNIGDTVTAAGNKGEDFFILMRGKVEVLATGPHKETLRLALLSTGDSFGELPVTDGYYSESRKEVVKALTQVMVYQLERAKFIDLLQKTPKLGEYLKHQILQHQSIAGKCNEHGEQVAQTHFGTGAEDEVPGTFIDYEIKPIEYPLNYLQSVLRINTGVEDIYKSAHDQLRQQLRLTLENIREKQEWELLNNKRYGLLNVVSPSMVTHPRTGAPTPDDLDELLSKVWKKPSFFLAHPRAIAAFARECTRNGVPPPTIRMHEQHLLTWRGVPLVPCDKIPVRSVQGSHQTSILLMRVGEAEQGVVGLGQLPDQNSGLDGAKVRFMGIDHRAVASYLVSLYFNVAVLTPDALGMLSEVEIGNYHDYDN